MSPQFLIYIIVFTRIADSDPENIMHQLSHQLYLLSFDNML